ncbi:MAG: hypothetical protein HS113_28675 [Verrucomicrobiales bacterium]|nr:hypothetical protein [Verrucomicrobiales bacterium]
MQDWNLLIDPSWFGLIAAHLRSPRSPVDCRIHVKDPERLPEVAERIDQDLARGDFPGGKLSPGLEALLQEGAIKVSSRHPLPNLEPGPSVDPGQVRSAASCDVLYVPPCYVVHTPGLFEEQAETAARVPAKQGPAQPGSGTSPEATHQPTKDRDLSHSH